MLIGRDEVLLKSRPVRILSFNYGHLVLMTIDELGGSTLRSNAFAQTVEDSVHCAQMRFSERVRDLHTAELIVGG